jgi:hypothetical protein
MQERLGEARRCWREKSENLFLRLFGIEFMLPIVEQGFCVYETLPLLPSF